MDKFLIRIASDAIDTQSESDESSSNDTKSNSKRNFRHEWKKKFPWLREVNGTSSCSACDKTLSNHLAFLKKHNASRAHVLNVEMKRNQIKTSSCLNVETTAFDKQVNHAELTLVMFIICHNLPFLLMDYFPKLLRECCPDSEIAKSLKCGRTKSTQIAGILGNKAKDAILGKLKTTKFSLIVDETTDLSTKKSLVLVARYFDVLARSIRDRFIGLIELVNTDANSIYEVIKTFFSEHNVPLKNIIGLATDGANVMAGEINGLQAKFKRDVDLFYIKCSCHSLHLCSAYACKKLPLQIETVCRNIYRFFAHSPKRINEFKEFQDYCSVKPHKILGICFTRWLALEQVINRLVEQWNPLQLYFISSYLEINGVKAADLAELMGEPSLKAYFLFLSYILKIINNLNKEFQSEKVRLPYFYTHIETNFKLILSNFMKNEYVKNLSSLETLDLDNNSNYLPISEIFIGNEANSYLQNVHLSDIIKKEIRINIRSFYVELLKQIKQRFDFSRADLKNLSIITPNRVMSNADVCISQLLTHFSHLNDCDTETIITEWKLLRFSNLELSSDMDIMEFWEKVCSFKNGLNESCFKNLSQFVISLLSLPHSSAAAERKFSDLALIKTKQRNKLDFKTINNIMLSKELCAEGNEPNYVWSAKNYF